MRKLNCFSIAKKNLSGVHQVSWKLDGNARVQWPGMGMSTTHKWNRKSQTSCGTST